jgi:hypothetical protein
MTEDAMAGMMAQELARESAFYSRPGSDREDVTSGSGYSRYDHE